METIRKHRRLAVFGSSAVVISLAALFIFSSFLFPAMQTAQQDQRLSTTISSQFSHDLGQALHPILTVKVFNPDGSLAGERIDRNDLILNNFINATQEQFTPAPSTSFMMTDTGGTKRALNYYSIANGYFWITGSSTYCVSVAFCGVGIEVGTGSTAAARTDHTIQTLFMGLMPVGQSGYDSTTGNVTVSASEVASSGATITEAGIIIQGYDGAVASPNTRTYLWFHDVFSGVAVTTGQTVSVQYTLELLNTGFTNSYGCMLSQEFSSANLNQADNPCTVYDVFGGSNSCSWLGATPGQTCFFAGDNSDPYILVGTGATAQARTFTNMVTSTCSTQAISTPTITSTSTLIIHATNNCASSVTITEAGLVVHQFHPNSYAPVMVWRTTFSGVIVTGPGTIQITFDLVFN